jgi:hypothetical protein
MRWTQRGTHLLLQTRVQVLNDDLRKTFGRRSRNESERTGGAKAGGIEASAPEMIHSPSSPVSPRCAIKRARTLGTRSVFVMKRELAQKRLRRWSWSTPTIAIWPIT